MKPSSRPHSGFIKAVVTQFAAGPKRLIVAPFNGRLHIATANTFEAETAELSAMAAEFDLALELKVHAMALPHDLLIQRMSVKIRGTNNTFMDLYNSIQYQSLAFTTTPILDMGLSGYKPTGKFTFRYGGPHVILRFLMVEICTFRKLAAMGIHIGGPSKLSRMYSDYFACAEKVAMLPPLTRWPIKVSSYTGHNISTQSYLRRQYQAANKQFAYAPWYPARNQGLMADLTTQ